MINKRLLHGEFDKLVKTRPFKLCIIVEIIYAMVKLGFKVVQSIMYNAESYAKTFVSQYEAAGYTTSEISEIMGNIRDPQAFSMLAECCAGMILCGMLAALFFATDHSNGMLRQIISRGNSRSQIYNYKLCATSIGAVTFTAITIVIYFLGTGLLFSFGEWRYETPTAYIVKYLIVVIVSATTFVCFGQMLASICKSKTSCILAVILTYFGSTVVITAINALPMTIDIDSWWFCSIPFYILLTPIADEQFITGILAMLTYCAIFYLIGYRAFRKKNL